MKKLVHNSQNYLLLTSIAFLLVATLLSQFFVGNKKPTESVVTTIEDNLSEKADELQKEGEQILERLKNSEHFSFTNATPTKQAFYIFKKGRLLYWSDYRYVPDYRYLTGNYSLKLVKTLRKTLLSRRWIVADSDVEVFGIIPLHNNYKVENNYLKSGYNPDIFNDLDLKIYSPKAKKGYDICVSGNNCLFKVDFAEDDVRAGSLMNIMVLILYVLGGLFLLIWILKKISSVFKRQLEMGIVIVIVLLMAIRIMMLLFGFPDTFIKMSLFDSRQFASSSFNPSFGDLYLNILCLLTIAFYVFRYRHRSLLVRKLLRAKTWVRRMGGVGLSALLFLTFHYQYLVFQTIYHNSQITYDISQTIRFNDERVVAFAIFITNTIIVFLIFHVIYRVLKLISRDKYFLWYSFILGLLAFAIVNWLLAQQFITTLFITSAYFLVINITRLPLSITRLRYKTFLYVFTGIIASSFLGALAIYQYEHEREMERKLKFAHQFLIENDNLAEYLLSEVNEKVKNDIFIQNRMSSPFLSKDIIKSKIRQVYLSNYFDKYDIKIYLYNANGVSFENAPISPSDIQSFNDNEYQTAYPNIYFINKFGVNGSKKYLDFIALKKWGVVVGYVIMDLSLKRIIPDNVYPELLVDNQFLFSYQHANYSYAVFINDDISYHSGDFNYSIDFNKALLEDENLFEGGVTTSQYRHIAVRDQEGRVVVISSPDHPFSNVVSNFSFLFLIQVFTMLVLSAGYALYFSFQHISLNYSAKIQLYLNIAFFLPLFAVSITTLSLINSSFKNELNEEYYRKAENISSNISERLDYFVNNIRADLDELPNELSEISKYAGVDVNLFSIWGKLLATSQPLIYENDLLSKYINPVAYAKIKEQGENVYVTMESVGTLQYYTTFYGVKSADTGTLIGIVSIPFFQSESALERNQIIVLTNVINIFSVIFIVFLMISFFAAKWLTFPLAFITQKLKKTTLTGFNEPLVWSTDDEIGLMVGEYNRMLINLEESKKALARSEKESAWREIAQQVAHEIKNPLTPMKLTLQHMSRKLLAKNKDEELDKPINSLLQQVDMLNDIASSFSSFAKMPIPENEPYEFSAVVKNITNLHRSTENVTIHLQMPDYPLFTVGDEQLMGRIITNIIINAIQVKENGILEINISLTDIPGNKLLLEIKDNGPGIDEAIYSKVFMPDFSTKETGSGIGLAIAKHGVEHAGGKIWFETEPGEGTSFFIELPMVV
ncbi:MAG: ATP-binding protein [Fulvivirga sp.]